MIKWTNVQNSFDVAIDCRVIKKAESSVMIKIYVRFSIRTCKEGNNKFRLFLR